MANVKNGAFREIIIDHCLQSRRGYSTQEIMDKCNDALTKRGELPVSSLNTIRNDILAIENRWNIVVESVRKGKYIRYRYENSEFSIYNSPLNDSEISHLTESITILKRFSGIDGFEWIDEMSARLQYTLNTSVKPIIGFDDNERLMGMHLFSILFNAISEQKAIELCYKSYKNKIQNNIIHPYYLKQYNQRWFLFGLNQEYNRISNFPLDRIQYIKEVDIDYIPNKTIDFQSFFDNVVGVSFKEGQVPVTIKLLVNKEQLPYVLSKPIHRTQKLIENRTDGSAILTIEVIPNFELTQLLLSFGDRVIVIAPDSLKEEIVSRIKNNLNNYQQVQLD